MIATQSMTSPSPLVDVRSTVISSALPPDAIARALPDAVPENAPAHCPGTESLEAGKASACEGCPNQSVCATAPKGPDPDLPRIAKRMAAVRNKILIMSGKGGVGKSTFTAQLAWAFATEPKTQVSVNVGGRRTPAGADVMLGALAVQTAVMDIDICGPSIPTILGLASSSVHSTSSGWSPVYVSDNLCAMSIGFLLPSASSAVIWRGPKKNGIIKQFLMDVDWTGGLGDDDEEEEGGDAAVNTSIPAAPALNGARKPAPLDYMLVDTPPGTSDEHLSIVSYLSTSNINGAVLLTTPQEVSLQDVRKEISFCRKMGVPILGVVENMAGFVCPACHGHSDVFYPSTGGAKALCEELDLNFLGSVPLDPRIGMCADRGLSFVDEYPESPASAAFIEVIDSE